MSVVKNSEFRFVFGLEKINEEISNRQFLETIKKVIGEFGFVLDVVQRDIRIVINNIAKTNHENIYFIDLDNTIIDLLNLTSRDYFDDIIDGVSSSFNEDSNFEEKDNENSEDEVEYDY